MAVRALPIVELAAAPCLGFVDRAEHVGRPGRRRQFVDGVLETIEVVQARRRRVARGVEHGADAERLADVSLHHRVHVRAPLQPRRGFDSPHVRKAGRRVLRPQVLRVFAEQQVSGDAERIGATVAVLRLCLPGDNRNLLQVLDKCLRQFDIGRKILGAFRECAIRRDSRVVLDTMPGDIREEALAPPRGVLEGRVELRPSCLRRDR